MSPLGYTGGDIGLRMKVPWILADLMCTIVREKSLAASMVQFSPDVPLYQVAMVISSQTLTVETSAHIDSINLVPLGQTAVRIARWAPTLLTIKPRVTATFGQHNSTIRQCLTRSMSLSANHGSERYEKTLEWTHG